MKIFLGTAEIAGMMHFMSGALRSCGHEVTTCIDNYGSGFFDHKYDVLIRPNLPSNSSNPLLRKGRTIFNRFATSRSRRKVYMNERDKHDLYLFLWNGFMKNSTDDFDYLKKQGKKIVSIFLGSDIRHVSAFAQEYKLDTSTWEKWFQTSNVNEQIFRLRKAELYSDAVFSVPDQSGLAVRPYHKIYIPFDLSPFTMNIPGRKIPKIIHIPSRTGIKGTGFIVNALDELKSSGLEFEFSYISGIRNTEVHELLLDADILIDEMYLHGPGTLSLEGVASGCAVATRTIPGEVYDDVLCNVNFDNFKEKIAQLIQDISYRTELARNAYAKVKVVNDPVRIAQDIVHKAITPVKNKSYDYLPTFYSDSYRLPSHTNVSEKNRELTRRVINKYDLGARLNVQRMQSEKLV